MITDQIKTALERSIIQYTLDEDSFNFKHPLCPKLVDCIITWEETRKQVQFVADYGFQLPPTLNDAGFAALLNGLNYDASWGNLETDGNGLGVYRLSTFLPDGRDAAVAICSKALEFFLKVSVLQLREVERKLNGIRKEEQGAHMRSSMPESLRSRILELECMHHRVMQLADDAELLFDEYQQVCGEEMTRDRLGGAGQERVMRDAQLLRQEEEKLHAGIRAFAQRCGLPLNLKELPDTWTLHGFRRDFALTGFLNAAITDLFVALCGGNGHAA